MKKTRINFIPADQRPQYRPEPKHIPFAILGAFAIYSVTSALSFQLDIQRKRTALAELTRNNTALEQRVAEADARQKREVAELERIKSLQEVIGRKSHWSAIFKELSILTPGEVWLTTLGTAKPEGGAKTLVLKGEATSQRKVAQFFAALEKSRFFKGAMISFSEKDPKIAPDLFTFEFLVPFPDPQGGES